MIGKPLGFLHVDVDGLWAVRACYGRREWDSFENDPCWTEGIPRLRQIFDQAGIPAAWFIVGRDLEVASKRQMASGLVETGAELGNHSYTHRIGLTRLPYGEVLAELQRTDKALRAIGANPIGFRAPGYDLDVRVLRAVRQIGYLYDASLLPTYLTPFLRLADAWLARRWDPRKRQFGRFMYGCAPVAPYFPVAWRVRKPGRVAPSGGVLEIPVGVTPGLGLPLTASSLFPMSRARIRALFQKLAAREKPVLLLLHAIDGVDCRAPIVFDNRTPALGGFSMAGEEKARRIRRIVEEFVRAFEVVRTHRFAEESWKQRRTLPWGAPWRD
jgi:hypothetical protein